MTTREHIEELEPAAWAALMKRAAAVSVAAAERLGKQPPAEVLAVAGMTEQDLVEHRDRFGPAHKRGSAVMRLVEADHLRVLAEGHTRDAQQAQRDAEATAALARSVAENSARDATAARDRIREIQAKAERREAESSAERAAERAKAQRTIEQLRGELDRLRGDTAAELAAAAERVSAAEARAEQRAAERATERTASQQTADRLRAELERLRADSAAETAAAGERAKAAEARAEQRIAERATERTTSERNVSELRAELERVRADAAAEVAASRGQASAEVSAAHRTADAEVARARAQAAEAEQDLHGEVERARAKAAAELDAARAQASAELAAALRTAEVDASHAREQADDALKGAMARAKAELQTTVAAAQAEVAGARAAADDARSTAQDEIARIRAEADDARSTAQNEIGRLRAEAGRARNTPAAAASSEGLLTIPIPPLGASAFAGPIEQAVTVVCQLDYELESGLAEDAAEDVDPPRPIDLALVRSLVGTVREQAVDIADELHNLPSHYAEQWQVGAARSYASAATAAYGAVLGRISAVTEQLSRQDRDANAEVISLVTEMIAEHPWRR